VILLLLNCLHPHCAISSKTHDSAALVGSATHLVSVYRAWIGGGRVPLFTLSELQPHVDFTNKSVSTAAVFKFVTHKHNNVANALYRDANDHVCGNVPLNLLADKCTLKSFRSITKIHHIYYVPTKAVVIDIPSFISDHHCPECETHVSVFVLHTTKSNSEHQKLWCDKLDTKHKKQEAKLNYLKWKEVKKATDSENVIKRYPFPPPPPPTKLKETIIRNWCEDISPIRFMESGCAV
jgi:hypothetical protein